MKINTKVMTAIFVVIILAVLVALTLQLVKQGGQEPAMPGMSAGEQMERAQERNRLKKAPDFTLTTFEGKKLTLSKLNQDKVVIVNFWASWCPSCREEAADLEKVWRQYKDRVHFIGVDIKDTKKDALAYIEEFKITYPNGFDENNINQAYGITGVPETFIIKDGLIYDHIIGATTVSDLSKRIEQVL